MGQMGRIEKQDGSGNGFMRDAMPAVTAWIDDLRAVFGKSDVTNWVREGLAEGTFYASEGGREVGQPPAGLDNAISLVDVVIRSPIAPQAPDTQARGRK